MKTAKNMAEVKELIAAAEAKIKDLLGCKVSLHLLTQENKDKWSKKDILTLVVKCASDYYDVTEDVITGVSKSDRKADYRAVCYKILREHFSYSITLKEIAEHFSKRHHSSIINALNTINDIVEIEPAARKGYNAVNALFIDRLNHE